MGLSGIAGLERIRDMSVVPFDWGLSRIEAEIVGQLLSSRVVESGDMVARVYGPGGGGRNGRLNINTHVCRARKKLRALAGVDIRNRRNLGWYLSYDDWIRLREMAGLFGGD